MTFKPTSYPTSFDEGTTEVSISMTFCNFKSCPLETLGILIWWLISKPFLRSEIANGIPMYRGHKSQNRSIPIHAYGPAGLKQTSLARYTQELEQVDLEN